MASILSLKRRIQAAKNVSKTTKAMQMIAASKLKRAQEAVTATRPYVNKISEMTGNIMNATPENYTHPYLRNTSMTGKTLLIIMAPDKGLSGSLITNIIREFIRYQKDASDTAYIVIGKKLENPVVNFKKEIIAAFPFGLNLPTFDMVYPLIKLIDDYYTTGKVDSVKVLTTEFTSVFTQKPKIVEILPIPVEKNVEKNDNNFFMFEPSPAELLQTLLKHYVEMTIYQQLVEAFVSEQAAKMMAMQNATNNANDIIEDLQLEYNKTRQAKITGEILDITGAAAVSKKE